MLTNTTNQGQQQTTTTTPSNADGGVGTTRSVSPTKNSIKSELSPQQENTNSQNMLDDTNPSSSSGVVGSNNDGGGGVAGVTNAAVRQNSVNAAASPNNNSDHSNCSNISTNLTQLVEATSADLIQDEQKNKKKICNKEEENGKTALLNDKNSNTKSGVGGVPNIIATIKDDPDLVPGLVNVKKEENLSPNMSPVGFGSIGGGSNAGNLADVTPAAMKMELTGNNPNEKMSGNLVGLQCDDNQTGNGLNDICAGSVAGGSGTGSISGNGNGGMLICGGQTVPGNFVAGNGGGGGGGGGAVPMGSCMDYMQQQNHIFVFSTQLANKGADSVLNGQFQTIIAYHCTQPATKNFFEDFFMKNPMKMNKLQRQNALNICNIPGIIGGGGQQWLNTGMTGGGPMSKLSSQQTKHNPNVAKMNVNASENNNNKAATMRSNTTNVAPFVEGGSGGGNSDTLHSENELMCWEQTRNSTLDGTSDVHALKLLDGSSGNDSLNKCNDSVDNTIPSLQGVKVPDENLTPQQRQHREEQLAKLKKMNQFLFPENEGPSTNQLNKLMNENMPGNMLNPTMNPPSLGGNNQTLNRQMQPNIINQNQQKSEPMPGGGGGLSEDGILPADIINDINPGMQQCNNTQKNSCGSMNTQGNISCVPGGVMGGGSGNMPGNNITCHGVGSSLISSSPELIPPYGGGGGAMSDIAKSLANQDMPPVGMAQMEWSKMQQQFFEERLKVGSKITNRPGLTTSGGLPTTSSTSTTIATSQLATNQTMRCNNAGNQGPPPPYHPTQRSASVPIATQSPNPTSPANPTSNLSLPSPRTTGALGIPANSPNMDAAQNTSTATTNTSTSMTTTTVNSAATKNCFQPEGGSPSNRNRGGTGGGSGVASGGGGGLNQFNSNPSTPLSHMSPKDLESFNTGTGGDIKNRRQSPQRPRSPNNCNNILDAANMDARFPASSPGLNFNAQMQNNPNSYKGPNMGPSLNQLERQNSAPPGIQSQFCRRADNLPLNPNSNRPTPNKMSQSFDPISSLAQMSQQLTSCVTGVGSGSNSGGMNMGGPNDVNQTMDGGMMPSMDTTGMEHMNNAAAAAAFAGVGVGNCHPMNPLMNPMGQRMLNPKMCGVGPGPSFNSNAQNVSGMRDGPNFHGAVMPPTTRMIGRMPVNFGNFNVSPNIQVKASTPNTIQYMPVRPQNNNSNNVRMPPSLEFLQRYANPQMAGGGVGPMSGPMGGPNDNTHLIGNVNMGGGVHNATNIEHKLPNNPNGGGGGGAVGNNTVGMNFFPNCNPMPGMDDEMALPNGMMPNHDMNIGPQPPMIRGMRPHSLRQHGMGARLQTPTGNIIGAQQQQQTHPFGHGPQSDDCVGVDPTAMFNASGPCNNGPSGMFGLTPQQQQQQMKALKGMQAGMCQNMNAPNMSNVNVIGPGPGGNGPPAGSSGMLPNEMQSPGSIGVGVPGMMCGINNMMPGGLGGNNNGPPPGNGPGGGGGGGGPVNPNNPNYKSFVGPTSNDLKYAQQYHSFQQQLYATNTRSQQQQQQGNPGNMMPNLSPNPAFFANK